jgi:hypothetical protein
MEVECFMDFDKIKITDIVPAQYNPRKISNEEYNKLSNSISEFGFVDPIIINLKNNHIIGGHQRYDVLLEEYVADSSKYADLFLIRLGDIGWVFPSSELEVGDMQHEKALNLALNRISGEWENEQLENLLIDLDIDGFDVTLTGFDNLDMKDLNFDLKISNNTPNDKLKSELEKENFEKEKNIKEYEEQHKDAPSENVVSTMKEVDVKEEIVYDGLDNEDNVEEKKYKYKCPICGYEWD